MLKFEDIDPNRIKRSKPNTANPELKGLSIEELALRYPQAKPEFVQVLYRRINGLNKKAVQDDYPAREYKQKLNQKKYVKGALKQMSKVSKHLNTQKFIEYFNEHIGVELIGQTLVEVLLNEDERTENKLKAVSEINKYAMIPSQAQEIKHEVDDSFGKSEREELQELLGIVRQDHGIKLGRIPLVKEEVDEQEEEEGDEYA